jgi:hypothetical protein
MHVFLLILSVMGQPERIAAVCETYKQCSDEGQAAQIEYVRLFKREPRDFAYRIVPATVTRDAAL